MYSITLVSTLHRELGKCNSNELYKIIESINPDVIFEELTPDLFDKIYRITDIPGEPPELKAVRSYLKNHSIKRIPVDVLPNSNLITKQITDLFDRFHRYEVHKKIEAEQPHKSAENQYAQ